MSDTHVPVRLRTNLRKLDSQDLDSEAQVLRYQTSIVGTPKAIGQGNSSLTSEEEKLVHRILFRGFVRDEDLVVKLSKNDVLAKNPGDHVTTGTVPGLFVLTIYEGQTPPPTSLKDLDYDTMFTYRESTAASQKLSFKEWSSFKRSSLPAGSPSSSRRRWVRIHATEHIKSKVQHDDANSAFNMEGVHFHLVPVKITCSKVTVRQALNLSSDTDGNDPAVGLDLLEFLKLGGTVGDDAEDLRSAQDERHPKSHDFPGVRAILEAVYHVRLNHNNHLLLSEKPHTSVYLKSDFKYLSDIVMEHCHSALHRLQSSEGIAMLTAKFKGVQVGKRTSGGYEHLTIQGFKLGTVSDVLPHEQHHAWPSEGGLILSPSLPLVDVGTTRQPLYLPMEVCRVFDKQPLHGPRDAALASYVNNCIRANALADLPGSCEEVQGSLIFHQFPEQKDLNDRLVKACDGNPPNLMFVEVGSTPIDIDRWSKLRSELRYCLHQSFAESTRLEVADSMPLLSLRYTSAFDPSTRWTQQLRDFVKAYQKPAQKAIVIVWLEPEQDRNDMYKIIKRACEVTIGAQTFFVKHETYATQMATPRKFLASVNSTMRSIADIRRRICQKNPQMLTKANKEEKPLLVVAMHVSQVTSLSQHGRLGQEQQGDSEIYLVSLVSRDATQSKNYHTEQGLFNGSQMKSYNHVKLLKAFLKILPDLTTKTVIVLRSGSLIPPARDFGAVVDNSDLRDSANPGKGNFSPIGVHTGHNGLTTSVQHSNSAGEIRAIEKLFKASKRGHLLYVTLTEDTGLVIRMKSNVYSQRRPSDNSPAILFTQDPLLIKAEDRSVKVQQVLRARWREDQEDHENGAEVRPGAITVTFYDSRQAVGEAPKNLTSPSDSSLTIPSNAAARKLSTMRPHTDSTGGIRPMRRSRPTHSEPTIPEGDPMAVDIFHDSLELQVSDKASASSDSVFKNDQATKADQGSSPPSFIVSSSPKQTTRAPNDVPDKAIDFLAGVWKDEELGLYNTKWPVPTHLARLATKRAMIHLRTDDWQSVTAPFSLPNVHQSVRDTLYYL